MRKKFSQIGSLAIAAALAVFLFSIEVNAHPGRTASDGCHYCRTNCAKWGEIQGARHCHGGYTPPAQKSVVETAPVIVEPSPSPIIVKTTPPPSPRFRPSLKPSPKPSPSPKVLGEEADSGSTGGRGLGVAALFGFVIWRAVRQKWPFHPRA